MDPILYHKNYVQWNLIITATNEPNISDSYIELAALQRCKGIKSHHLGLELGGCNNEVAGELRRRLH